MKTKFLWQLWLLCLAGWALGADQKITDLTAITGASVATGDVFPLVDVSDTTMAASGTNKKITTAELIAAIKALGGSTGGNGAADNGRVVIFDSTGQITSSNGWIIKPNAPFSSGVLTIRDPNDAFNWRLKVNALTVQRTVFAPDADGTMYVVGQALGTPLSGDLSNCTGLPVGSITGLGANVATWLATPSLANFNSALSDADVAILAANTFTGQQIVSLNGAASTPPLTMTGTWFSGGSSTTTKPQLLVEPTGTTTNTWPTGGTGLGVNAPSGFTGDIAGFYRNGVAYFRLPGGAKPRLGSTEFDGITLVSQYGNCDIYAGSTNNWTFAQLAATAYGSFMINSGGGNITYLYTESPGNRFQMGIDATTPSAQTFKGPDTTTNGNAGAALSIQGGNGLTSGAGGALNLDGGDSPSGTDGNVVIGGTRGNVVIGPSGTAFNKSAVYTYALTETVEAQTIETITVTATGVADGDKVAVEIPDPGDGVCVQSIDCTTDAIVVKYWNTNTVTNRTLSGTLRFRTFEE